MSRLAPDKEDQATEFCSIAVQLLIAQCTCTRINRLMQHRGATRGHMDGTVGMEHLTVLTIYLCPGCRVWGWKVVQEGKKSQVSFMFKFFVCLRIHYWQKAVWAMFKKQQNWGGATISLVPRLTWMFPSGSGNLTRRQWEVCNVYSAGHLFWEWDLLEG